jgi:hypothetical protein
MIHSIGYLGPYDTNIGRIASNSDQYLRKDGTAGDIDAWPDAVDGIFFGYLEKPGREFFAVRATYLDDVVNVGNPVRLDPPRHTDGKKFGPQPSQFGDDSARNLLQDLIGANPAQADDLKAIGTKTGLLL